MKFSVWPNLGRPVAEILDTGPAGPTPHGWYGVWYADHYMPNTGSEAIAPGDTARVLGDAAGDRAPPPSVSASARSSRRRRPPPRGARQPGDDDRPHLRTGGWCSASAPGGRSTSTSPTASSSSRPAARVERFEEAIQIIRGLLDRGAHDVRGRDLHDHRRPADPEAVQSPLPLLVGTASPRMLRHHGRARRRVEHVGRPRVGRRGSGRAFVAACERVGRDPARCTRRHRRSCHHRGLRRSIERARAGGIADAHARRLGRHRSSMQIGRYAELGFDEFIVPDWAFLAIVDTRHGLLVELFTARPPPTADRRTSFAPRFPWPGPGNPTQTEIVTVTVTPLRLRTALVVDRRGSRCHGVRQEAQRLQLLE